MGGQEGPKLLLDAFVPGRPRPKGSMDLMPNGYAKQNNAASTPWQREMETVFRRITQNEGGRPGKWTPRVGYPYALPVVVFAEFYFERPAHPQFDVPASGSTGDVDKLTRNLLDALEEAKVYTNDTRVVDLFVSSRYVNERTKPGVQVWVYGLKQSIVSARSLRGTWLMLQRAPEANTLPSTELDNEYEHVDPFALPSAPARKEQDVGPVFIAAYEGSCAECCADIEEGDECRYVEGEVVRQDCCGVAY